MNPQPASRWRGSPALRSSLLFLNLFVILLAYYLVKPASRSLYLEHASADSLPYLWTGSALLMLVLLPSYQKLLHRYDRISVVLGSCVITALLLLAFYGGFEHAGLPTAVGFYVLADIFSVVLIEQFWSLTNSVFNRHDGKRWYGLIASGGLVGGMAGGSFASYLVEHTGMQTHDLILVAAGLLLAMSVLTWRLAHHGLYGRIEAAGGGEEVDFAVVLETLRKNRFVFLMALLLLLSQVCEPIIEYQFMHHVEAEYADREQRTIFLSNFLSLLSAIALGVNLLLTPLIHRFGGIIGGLMVQPIALGISALGYVGHVSLPTAAAMKIADRGLSYSVNRASRELLYVGADAGTIFKVKAWIDMVGYRTFKIIGNVAIIALIPLLPTALEGYGLAAVVVGLSVVWTMSALALREVARGPGAPPPKNGKTKRDGERKPLLQMAAGQG